MYATCAERSLIREEIIGEALDQHEIQLDRKLERTLAMLLRGKKLRRPATLVV